ADPTGGAKASAVSIALSGIDSDIASGTITLSDGVHQATYGLTAGDVAAGTVTLGASDFSNFAGLDHTDSSITVTASVTDDAGNTASPSSQTFVLDTTAPTAALALTAISTDSGTSSSDFITSDTSLTVSGTHGALGSGEK